MRFAVPDLTFPDEHPKAVRRAVAQRAQAVRRAFRDHNERIRPLLPPSLQRLQETGLHDGLVRSLCIDPVQRTLQLCLLCGDLQRGYFDLTLDYMGIELSGQEASLLCLIAHEESSEICRDEVDVEEAVADTPVFIHRILWTTCIKTWREPAEGEWQRAYTLEPEIELRFRGFGLETTPRPDRQLARADRVITVVRDPGGIEGMA